MIPGLKLGHIVARRNWIEDFYSYASTSYGSPASFTYAVTTVLSQLELGRLRRLSPELEPEVLATLSDAALLVEEFAAWHRAQQAFSSFVERFIDGPPS